MNILAKLRECEPKVVRIAKDAGVSRQSVHAWGRGVMPSEEAFYTLLDNEKYSDALADVDYEELRKERPVGRPRLDR